MKKELIKLVKENEALSESQKELVLILLSLSDKERAIIMRILSLAEIK